MTVRSLYLHIPFCHAKCAYCDFDSRGMCGIELERASKRYLDALLRRIDAFGSRGALAGVETVYIGGGTPTVLGGRLADLVRHVLRWCRPCEVTCEANPESLSSELALSLAEVGVTRVSIGVQSLIDGELRSIGRLHDGALALAALRRAHDAGLDVSCDLMCGLPGQTERSWDESLSGVLGEGPDHVSVYPLTLEEGTPLALRSESESGIEPDADFQAWCMERASEFLTRRGFERYEVASYARPGKRCRHNIAYWTGASYLGIGRSAAGMLEGAEFAGVRDLFPGLAARRLDGSPGIPGEGDRVRFVQEDDAGTRFSAELLDERESVSEDLMLGLRMCDGVGAPLIARARELAGAERVDGAVDSALARGLARWSVRGGSVESDARGACGERLVPTGAGWLLGNELYGLFWDLAHDDR